MSSEERAKKAERNTLKVTLAGNMPKKKQKMSILPAQIKTAIASLDDLKSGVDRCNELLKNESEKLVKAFADSEWDLKFHFLDTYSGKGCATCSNRLLVQHPKDPRLAVWANASEKDRDRGAVLNEGKLISGRNSPGFRNLLRGANPIEKSLFRESERHAELLRRAVILIDDVDAAVKRLEKHLDLEISV